MTKAKLVAVLWIDSWHCPGWYAAVHAETGEVITDSRKADCPGLDDLEREDQDIVLALLEDAFPGVPVEVRYV